MDEDGFWDQLVDHLGRSLVAGQAADDVWVLGGAVLGLLLVLTPLWRLSRTAVTVVHELGHALVGVLCGRRFTGLVINPDMSGHTVTRGRGNGPGMVATSAAGYPMPLVCGAALVVAVGVGRTGVVLLLAILALLVGLLRSRSVYTVVVMLTLLAGTVALWWLGAPDLGVALVTGAGVTLLAGGWRQLVNVALHGDRRQDPGMLAAMTRIPAAVWVLAFAGIGAAATWWAVRALVGPVTGAIS
ncbi:MAG: M50 family metallopeptidase [Pauljensenia sp.]